jgi:hypothetical protein
MINTQRLLFKKGNDNYVYMDITPWLPPKLTKEANENIALGKTGYKDPELNRVYKILQLQVRRYVLEHEGNVVQLEKVPTPMSLYDVWNTYHLPEPNVRLPKPSSPLEHVAWSLATQNINDSLGSESLLYREEYLYYRLERIKETWLSYVKTRGLSAT